MSTGNIRIIAIIHGTELLGSERGNLEALRALHNTGAAVHVGISSREADGGAVGTLAREWGFSCFLMPFGSHFSYRWMRYDKRYRKNQFRRIFQCSIVLWKEINRFQPTHLWYGSTLPVAFTLPTLLLRRTPLIYRMGDAPDIGSKFQMFLWNFLVRRSTRIVAVSKFIRKALIDHHPKLANRSVVIYNKCVTRKTAIDCTQLEKLQKRKSRLQFVYVGQMVPQKGVGILLDAFIQMDDPEIGAWFVGGSQHTMEFESELRHRVANSATKTKIIFYGFLDDPRPFYQTADWHMAPSICEEALGNVVLEAKDCAVPSIVSNNGGLPELIKNGVDGYILKEVSPHMICELIKIIQKDTGQWKKMGLLAKESLLANFNETVFTKSWRALVTPS